MYGGVGKPMGRFSLAIGRTSAYGAFHQTVAHRSWLSSRARAALFGTCARTFTALQKRILFTVWSAGRTRIAVLAPGRTNRASCLNHEWAAVLADRLPPVR